MPRFVRCIEGHVFDAEAATQCPVCGAAFEVAPPPSADVLSPSAAAPAASGTSNRFLIVTIVVALLGVGLGAGALAYALHESAPATTAASNAPGSSAEDTKDKPGPDTATPAAPPAPKTAATGDAGPAPAVASPPFSTFSASPTAPLAPTPALSSPAEVSEPKVATLSQQSQSPATPPSAPPGVNVSGVLQTAINVARMLAAFREKKYGDALSQTEPLIGVNNPIAMFVKAAILQNGLTGHQDSVQARDLLAKGTELGDPTSTLFYGRMLEKGIGGAPDPEKAKQLYLLASRGMASAADQDLARLHLDGARGMTALEAYQFLASIGATPNASKAAAMGVLNELYSFHSTTAVCLRGWMVHDAATRGWTTLRGTGQLVGGNYSKTDVLSADDVKGAVLQDFVLGAVRSDPWCEWGMATLAAEGVNGYPKNQVEADVFYRLAAMNRRLGADAEQVKQKMADLESRMSTTERAQADRLFRSAVPSSMAP